MHVQSSSDRPLLFVLDQHGRRDRQLPFTGAELHVGRHPAATLHLNSPEVSRQHARLWREGHRVFVEDLASTAGTALNGNQLDSPCEVRPGDIITFASVSVEFALAPVPAPATESPENTPPHTANFTARDQRAENIHMVGGNQYNLQLLEQRRSLLLDIAATKTKARWILVTGFFLNLIGFGLFAAGILRSMTDLFNQFSEVIDEPPGRPETPMEFINPLGFEIFGIPSGLLGWVLAGLGIVLVIIGAVLHLKAMGQRQRVERELPLPIAQWTPEGRS